MSENKPNVVRCLITNRIIPENEPRLVIQLAHTPHGSVPPASGCNYFYPVGMEMGVPAAVKMRSAEESEAAALTVGGNRLSSGKGVEAHICRSAYNALVEARCADYSHTVGELSPLFLFCHGLEYKGAKHDVHSWEHPAHNLRLCLGADEVYRLYRIKKKNNEVTTEFVSTIATLNEICLILGGPRRAAGVFTYWQRLHELRLRCLERYPANAFSNKAQAALFGIAVELLDTLDSMPLGLLSMTADQLRILDAIAYTGLCFRPTPAFRADAFETVYTNDVLTAANKGKT